MKDVLILGGGVIGLSLAVELALRGLKIEVLEAHCLGAASAAAGGMLAPDAEGLDPAPFAALGRNSRDLWPQWREKLEYWAAMAGMADPRVGYQPSGILSPQREKSTDDTDWWDRTQVETRIPSLGAAFAGAVWHPKDGHVDPRRLLAVLKAACTTLGVTITAPVIAEALRTTGHGVEGVITNQGVFKSGQYVLCSGSWSAQLLPLPVFPIKGQMLALQMPHPGLECVIFGPGTYLIPRREGRLVVGATQENVGFTEGTTSAGLEELLTGVQALLPGSEHWPILETWYGYRPATPDLMPILGASPYRNLWLATGHHRNGILLSPITAYLLAEALAGAEVPSLEPFHYSRFPIVKQKFIPGQFHGGF